MKLKNKIIVITGAGHGIGRAIVEGLSEHKASIAFTYRHDKEGAAEIIKILEKKQVKVKAYQIDELSDELACKKVFEKIIEDFGHIDAVIANASGAGVAGTSDNLYDLDLKAWNKSLNDNLLVAITTAKFAIQELNKNPSGGKLLFIGSVLGLEYMGNPKISAYNASKAAVHNFAKTIAKPLAPKILVNVVAPGRCWSKAYDNAPEEFVTEKFIVNRHNRPIEWPEIALAVRMVLENDSIIGQVITVDAGFSLKDA